MEKIKEKVLENVVWGSKMKIPHSTDPSHYGAK
jgi:hypothetical protein